MVTKRALLRSVFLSAPLLVPAFATAQTSAGPVLDEIVVTAQKRGEDLQEVPIAIIAASGETIAAAGVTSTTQLNTIAPGLNIRVTGGSFMPSIRGIGTSSNVVENPVSLYIDGVYLPQQREGLRDLSDIEQVAVLKGPQGTLFGRNATAGVIQVTTRRPQFRFNGQAGLELDNYRLLKGDLFVTGPLGERMAASLALSAAGQQEGWGRNLTTGADTFRLRRQTGVRAKLLFEPDDRTSITLAGDYLDRSAAANTFQPFPGTRYSFGGVGPLSSPYDTYAGIDSTVEFKGGGAALTIERELGFAKLVSITAYREGHSTVIWENGGVAQANFIIAIPDSPNESYSQELQLVSAPGRLKWVVGAFYFHNENTAVPIQRLLTGPQAPLPTSVTVNTTFGREVAESIAPFAQLDWAFLPKATLTLGARYTYEKRTADVGTTLLRNNGTSTVQALSGEVILEKPTYRAALAYRFTDDILGYVSVNTGIKSGGFNIVNAGNAGYLPESLTAYETGVKTELFGGRLRLNAAAFRYDYKNVQVIQFIGGTQSIVNGAEARLNGLDIDLQAQITDALRLTLGVGLLDSEFTNYRNAVFSRPNPGGGATLSSGNATGNRLPLAQEASATLMLEYSRPVGEGSVDANLTANYNGKYYFEADNFLYQPDYLILNVSLKYNFPDKRHSIALWGRNLLNEEVIAQSTSQGFGYTATYGSAPTTYGVSVRARF